MQLFIYSYTVYLYLFLYLHVFVCLIYLISCFHVHIFFSFHELLIFVTFLSNTIIKDISYDPQNDMNINLLFSITW